MGSRQTGRRASIAAARNEMKSLMRDGKKAEMKKNIDLELAEDRGHEFLAYYQTGFFSTSEIAEFFETTPGTVAAGILHARTETGT